MNDLVVAITGPTGSGKTSVSLALAKKIEQCVFIEVDHIKHMIISGFYKEKDKWHYSEWELVGETIGLICNNFLKNGHAVVIGGYLHKEAWEELEKITKIKHKFMLNPSKETIKVRDDERDSKYYMGPEEIQEHIDYLTHNDMFDAFTEIDSTQQTVDETAKVILEEIHK